MMRFLHMALLSLSAAPVALGQTPEIGIEQRMNVQAPLDVSLRNERGATVKLNEYLGKRPVILVLGYYRCPRLCSIAFTNLAAALRQVDYQMGRDFDIINVSIDPRETSQEAAAKKAIAVEQYGRPGAETGWHFLTGDDHDIHRLADAVGFRYAYDASRDQYAHASGVIVLTPDGKVARYLFGLQYSARDLRYALEDASAGTIGSPVEQPLRMLCFAYDPQTGRYTLMTMRLVQIASLVTVTIFGILLARSWRNSGATRIDREGEAPAEP